MDKNYREFIQWAEKDFRKYRAHKILLWSLTAGFSLLIINMLINILGVTFVFWLESWYFYLFVLPILSVIVGYFWPIKEKELVLRVDRRLELKEKLITVSELVDNKEKNPYFNLLSDNLSRELGETKQIFPREWLPELKFVLLSVVIALIVFVGGSGRIYYPLQINNAGDFTSTGDQEADSGEIKESDFGDFLNSDLENQEEIEETEIPSVRPESEQESDFSRSEDENNQFRENDFSSRSPGENNDNETDEQREQRENDFSGEGETGQDFDSEREGDMDSESQGDMSFPGDFDNVPEGEAYVPGEGGEEVPEDEVEDLEDVPSAPGEFADENQENSGTEDPTSEPEFQTKNLGLQGEEDFIIADLENLAESEEDGLTLKDLEFEYDGNLPGSISEEQFPVMYRELIRNYLGLIQQN